MRLRVGRYERVTARRGAWEQVDGGIIIERRTDQRYGRGCQCDMRKQCVVMRMREEYCIRMEWEIVYYDFKFRTAKSLTGQSR